MQRYQENHIDEIEIINLHKRCNNTKTAAKTGGKIAKKAPKSGYHLSLREQLDKITGEDQKNYCSIVSRMRKDVKEDPIRLSVYNDRARQIRNEKPGDYFLKTMAERSAVRQPQKAPKTPTFVDTDLYDSDDDQERVAEKPQESTKVPKFVNTDSDDSDDEQEPAEFAYIDPSTSFLVKHPQKVSKTSGAHNEDPQKTSRGPVYKEPT